MPKLELRSHRSLTDTEKERKLFAYMVVGAYALMAEIVTNLYFKVEVEFAPARLVDLANFVARRPYQYRVLVPAIVHVAARLVHASQFQYFPIYQAIELGCVLATVIAYRTYLSQFIAPSTAALLAGMILIPMTMMHISCAMCRFPSDTPAILFFLLGLIAIRRRNFPALYAILAIATVNRESSALLIPAFAATMFGQLPKRTFALHMCALSLLWCAAKLAIDHIFDHNAGGPTEDHLSYNVGLFQMLLHGQPNILLTTAAGCAIAGAIFAGRACIPASLLRQLILVPIYAVIMWQVGIFDEARAWNEIALVVLTPIIVLLANLADSLSRSQSTVSAEQTSQDPPSLIAA